MLVVYSFITNTLVPTGSSSFSSSTVKVSASYHLLGFNVFLWFFFFLVIPYQFH
nr:MAG TPA_asm: hypothetical protein [Bacteriophage sp.]